MSHPAAPESPPQRVTPLSVIVDVLRGALIGMAELVPGVSGGTIALIVGVYVRLIDSANHIVGGLRRLVTGPDRVASAKDHFRKVQWALVLPLLVGMAGVVFTMAGVMSAFVTNYPTLSRGLFLGMVVASVVVPILQIAPGELASGAAKLRAVGIVAAAAVAAFLLTGSAGATVIEHPSLWLVFVAAAFAICALVLPGISGSFLLLTIGIYGATTAAVHDRNLTYIAVFAAGAALGLALFVKGLHWLLHNHHTATMLAMAGLMLGSLRALWPWQGEHRELLAVGADWLPALGLAVLGALVVAGLVYADRRMSRSIEDPDAVLTDDPAA